VYIINVLVQTRLGIEPYAMLASDVWIEQLAILFNDMKHRAVSLQDCNS